MSKFNCKDSHLGTSATSGNTGNGGKPSTLRSTSQASEHELSSQVKKDQFQSNWQHAILQQTDEYQELRKQCFNLMNELKVGQEAREWIDKELLNYETDDLFDQCDDLTRRQAKTLNDYLKPFLVKFKEVKLAKKDELSKNNFFEDLVCYADAKSIHLPQNFIDRLISLVTDDIAERAEVLVQCESMTHEERWLILKFLSSDKKTAEIIQIFLQTSEEYIKVKTKLHEIVESLNMDLRARSWIEENLQAFETADDLENCEDLTKRQIKALKMGLNVELEHFFKLKEMLREIALSEESDSRSKKREPCSDTLNEDGGDETNIPLGEIQPDLSGDSASRVAARRMEFSHATTSTFEQNFLGLGKNFMSANVADTLLNLPSIVAVQPSGGIGDCPKLHRGTRAGKCYNVTPSYTGRYFLRVNNRSNEGYGDLMYPWGIAVTVDDQIIVVDDGNERIQFFDSEGCPLRTFSAASAAAITAFAQQGGDQQHTQATGSSPGIHAAPAQPESRPDAQGTVRGSNNNNATRVQPPQAGITSEETVIMDKNVSLLQPSFRYTSGICVDDKNRLCITEEDTARLHFYSVGGKLEQTVELGRNVKPRAVILDTQDNIYVTDVENCCIYKYNSVGEHLQSFASRDDFLRPSFLALSTDEEKLIVSDTGYNRVFVLSAHTGEIITSFGMTGHHDLMFNGPCGIAIDGAGNMNVIDSGNNRIQVVTMQGEFVAEICLPWFMESGCDMPGGFRDIAFLSNGQYVVTDHANHRILIL